VARKSAQRLPALLVSLVACEGDDAGLPADRSGEANPGTLIVISPWAKRSHIDSTTFEFSSFLAFLERRFDIPPLTRRDRVANDLFDALDFDQEPLAPLILEERPEVEDGSRVRCRLD